MVEIHCKVGQLCCIFPAAAGDGGKRGRPSRNQTVRPASFLLPTIPPHPPTVPDPIPLPSPYSFTSSVPCRGKELRLCLSSLLSPVDCRQLHFLLLSVSFLPPLSCFLPFPTETASSLASPSFLLLASSQPSIEQGWVQAVFSSITRPRGIKHRSRGSRWSSSAGMQ